MPPTANIVELLQHEAWLRRLARCLVGDSAAADDLVQDTWVAALRSPPLAGATVRSWLAEVLRNLFRGARRSEARRVRRHEAAVDESGARAATDDVVAAARMQRDLAELVLNLDEPYRTTVLLRFYEGLTATEIGMRLGVASGTVRWRLKTAIDRIKGQLDGMHAGGRNAWLSALAPVASMGTERGPSDGAVDGAVPASPAGQATQLVAHGGLGMKTGIVLAATLIISTVGVAAWRTRAPGTPLASSVAGAVSSVASSVAAPQGLVRAQDDGPVPGAGRLDVHERGRLLARIAESLTASGSPLPPLDKDYIRGRMQELMPMLQECYQAALRNDRSLSGKLVIAFTIVADPTYGGLVADSKVDEERSTITDAGMRECVQESVYGARFRPPPGPGEVRVSYPFVFESDAHD